MPKKCKKCLSCSMPRALSSITKLILSQWLGHKWGGGGGPPRGFSIRRPPLVVQGVLDTEDYLDAKAQHSNLNILAQVASEPLSIISPQAPRDHRKPSAKKRKSMFFFSAFLTDSFAIQNAFQKILKKMRKSMILASQNPPKTPPKSLLF